jgi:hypothetical protein
MVQTSPAQVEAMRSTIRTPVPGLPSRTSTLTGSASTVALARRHRNHVPVGVDDHQRGRRAHAVVLPGLQLRVVEHRMRDSVACDGTLDGGMVGLVGKLRRMHADDHEPVAETFLEPAQLLGRADS